MAKDEEKDPDGGPARASADEARSPRRAPGPVHRPRAGSLRPCLEQAATVRGCAEGGRQRRRGSSAPPMSPRSTWPCSAPAPRAGPDDPDVNIPGLRFQAVCDIWEDYNQKRAVRILKTYSTTSRVRRLPGDARQGEGPRRGHHRHPRLLARRAYGGLPEAGCTSIARRRCRTPWRAPAHGARRPEDAASSCRSATSGAATRATCTATTSSSRKRSCSAGSPPSTASGTARCSRTWAGRSATRSRRPR